MEMELKVDSNSMSQLLKFLTGGFNGGTDVDKPLELSLQRLSEKEWNQVCLSAASLSAWSLCIVYCIYICMQHDMTSKRYSLMIYA